MLTPGEEKRERWDKHIVSTWRVTTSGTEPHRGFGARTHAGGSISSPVPHYGAFTELSTGGKSCNTTGSGKECGGAGTRSRWSRIATNGRSADYISSGMVEDERVGIMATTGTEAPRILGARTYAGEGHHLSSPGIVLPRILAREPICNMFPGGGECGGDEVAST